MRLKKEEEDTKLGVGGKQEGGSGKKWGKELGVNRIKYCMIYEILKEKLKL